MDEIVADSRFFTFLLWKNVSSMIITTTKVRKIPSGSEKYLQGQKNTTKVRKIPSRSENIKSSHASRMIVVDSYYDKVFKNYHYSENYFLGKITFIVDSWAR